MQHQDHFVKTIALALLLGCNGLRAAEKPQEVAAPVSAVKVCLNMAQISHSKTVRLKPGLNKLAFVGLASQISSGQISLRNIGQGELLSLVLVKISDATPVSEMQDDLAAMMGRLRDSLTGVERSITRLEYDTQALELEQKLLSKNDDLIPNGKQMSLVEFKATTDFYRERYRDSHLELAAKSNELRDLKKRKLRLLKSAFNVDSQGSDEFTFCIIVAEINNPGAGYAAEMELSYLSAGAGWIPMYEVMAGGKQDLKVNYRARVLNNTGLDWSGQAISLSTADPMAYYETPDLKPDYMRNYNYRNNAANQQNTKNAAANEEAIMAPDKEINFKLARPYNFKSGLVPSLVDVTSFTLSPEYLYRSAPSKEEQVYQLARVKDWERLNLMDGEAEIYNNGRYIGKTYIKPSELEDYLELPLGVVEQVYVRHKLVSEYSAKKTIGSDMVATFTYETKIKNTGSDKITVAVMDQVPVSESKSIKEQIIEMTEGGEQDALTGIITWSIELAPSSEKTILLKYSVSYPRNQQLRQRYQKQMMRSKF